MDFSKITVAVIGLGLMGGSFAMRLKELGAAVIGINRTLSMAEAALRQGIVDSIDISDLKHADIVIFCTPAKATLAFVKDHLPDFRSNAIMTDIAGVKGNLADDIRQILPLGMDFISSHPMCGHEGEGLSRADPDIFRGANYILLPDKTNRPESVELLRNMALALGCRHVPSITPEEHDRHIAYTSDLTHVLAAALINSPSLKEDTKYFTGGSFRDETRVADINSPLWTDLFLANRENLLLEIDRFTESLSQIKTALDRSDKNPLHELLEKAGKRKRNLTAADKI